MQTFSSFVATALKNGPPEGLHHYLLVDAAVADGRNMDTELKLNTKGIDLLTGEACRWQDCASPVLLSLPVQPFSPAIAQATERAVEKWRYANALIYIESSLSEEHMRTSLLARTFAVLPQNLDVLLRFFDTRVFDRLLIALTPEQRHTFLSAGATWAFPDRWGHLRVERAAAGGDTFAGPLRLDDHQEGILIDAGDADAMVDALLNQQHPSLGQRLPPEQYEAVDAALKQAFSLGIQNHSAQLAFCSLSLELGSGFQEQMPWSQWMPEVKTGKKNFDQIVAMAAESDQA